MTTQPLFEQEQTEETKAFGTSQPSLRDLLRLTAKPNVETLGYCWLSLRDNSRMRLRDSHWPAARLDFSTGIAVTASTRDGQRSQMSSEPRVSSDSKPQNIPNTQKRRASCRTPGFRAEPDRVSGMGVIGAPARQVVFVLDQSLLASAATILKHTLRREGYRASAVRQGTPPSNDLCTTIQPTSKMFHRS